MALYYVQESAASTAHTDTQSQLATRYARECELDWTASDRDLDLFGWLPACLEMQVILIQNSVLNMN